MNFEIKVNDHIPLASIPGFSLAITEGETVQSLHFFVYVLECISMLMQQKIPSIGSRPLMIINCSSLSNPTCLRDANIILLHTAPSRWAQIAYQYAHELCHFSIPNEVPSKLRWLEESICEMASLYFLRQIAYLWRERGNNLTTSDGKPYTLSFLEYAEDTATKFTEFDLRDSAMIEKLEHDCYQRSYNMHLANQLLPIFIEHPGTWEAVPFLCQIQEQLLPEALDAWILLSPPQAQPGLRRIRSLF